MFLSFINLVFSAFLGFSSVFAEPQRDDVFHPDWTYDENYFTVSEVNVQEKNLSLEDIDLLMSINPASTAASAPGPTSGLKVDDFNLSQVINIGKMVWKIVVANKPVVNSSLVRANALPGGSKNWFDLENWRDPVAKKYVLSYKNLYGIEVVKFDYLITYSYNGQVDGGGRYLSEVGFVPLNLTVAWMYNFEATSEVVRIINVGSSQDPIAGLELNLNWTVKTPLKEERRANNFYIRGDGGFRMVQ